MNSYQFPLLIYKYKKCSNNHRSVVFFEYNNKLQCYDSTINMLDSNNIKLTLEKNHYHVKRYMLIKSKLKQRKRLIKTMLRKKPR